MTAEDAPPVPTIPDDMRSITNQSSSHKRATSLQMQPFRVASQKKQEGAGSWFGAAAEGNMANVRTSDALMRVASPESRPGAPNLFHKLFIPEDARRIARGIANRREHDNDS
ncbi:LOW QUALITY PROTEIN: hypothetical protein CH63R_07427 [Colletotrichum higginsianum IMI 349063]|uniref:Uncharacterized protein n=1 Tax=Colletotrichum higginsianum (strain IMI 349063) TaxID=759273 RepID=A0A1B7Y9D3_COLHI|nr:LOW QUALITY PROTEIN: hypothetical protein CH63R_07427 [Colletotrichum higginsianum IMI 349063]OBR08662.1 LOW QUALITY PROTEIN: hypothetical protein CH63R_07427 [Colletotrichum higginsianum IMI 349063]